MESVGAILGQTASVAANTSQGVRPQGGDTAQAQAQNVSNNNAVSQSAANVASGAESKTRAASSGDNRKTDAAFDKEKSSEGSKSNSRTKKSINVTA
jgi:negative regulator of sigma E activity